MQIEGSIEIYSPEKMNRGHDYGMSQLAEVRFLSLLNIFLKETRRTTQQKLVVN